MSKLNVSDYLTVQNQISTEDPVSSAAELQGLICGLICANDRGSLPEQYQDSALMHVCYKEWQAAFSAALNEDSFSLQLLLPDDEQPLKLRIQAVAAWAQGFLAGLGEGGFSLDKNKDVQEILEDFQAIAQLQEPEDEQSEESDEKAFFEIVEYIRMAVLSFYTDVVIATHIEHPKSKGLLN